MSNCALNAHSLLLQKCIRPKTIFPVIIKRKNSLPNAPDEDLDEVIHGTYVVVAPAICTLHTKKFKNMF